MVRVVQRVEKMPNSRGEGGWLYDQHFSYYYLHEKTNLSYITLYVSIPKFPNVIASPDVTSEIKPNIPQP